MRFKKFVGRALSSCRTGLFLLLIASVFACKKDAAQGPPTSLVALDGQIRLANLDTAVTLTWNKAFTAWEGENKPDVRYEVEVSLDPTFENQGQQAYAAQTDSAFIHLNEDQLTPFEIYYARVRSVAGPNEARSNWLRTAEFHILDEVPEITMLRPVKNHEITDNVAIVRWGSDGEHEVTHFVLTEGDQEAMEVQLSAGELAAGTKTLEELTSSQEYTIQLFAGDRSMGTTSFVTKPSIDDLHDVVDLRSNGDPAALRQTLNTVAEGSTIVLARGSVYTFPDLFALDRSVTIMSEPGFGAPARLEFGSSLDVEAGSDIGTIVFNGLELTGNIESTYIFNLSPASTVGQIELEDCLISDHRGVIRMKDANTKTLGTIVINNSVVRNIRDYGVINVDNAAASLGNIYLTNSTIINAERMVTSRTALGSVNIENVTFYNAPHTNRFVVDYNQGSVSRVTIRSTIFGETDRARATNANINSVSVTNSFATSDFDNNGRFDGVESYSGASTVVFASPANGDFTIRVADLETVGDPRWRP